MGLPRLRRPTGHTRNHKRTYHGGLSLSSGLRIITPNSWLPFRFMDSRMATNRPNADTPNTTRMQSTLNCDRRTFYFLRNSTQYSNQAFLLLENSAGNASKGRRIELNLAHKTM